MALRKADIGISERAVEEIYRLFPTMGKAAKATGINKKIISQWQCENRTPSGFSLQQLYYAGADVIYILSGKRNPDRR